MLELFSRYWWTLALRGVLAVAFGAIALIWPTITVGVLVLLFGAYALVDGLFALGTALFGGRLAAGRRGWLLLEGVVGIAAGVVTFAWPAITALALLYLIAAWAIVTGVAEIAAAVLLRRELQGEWLLALGGVVSVLFGLYVAIWPGRGAVAVAWVIGLYAIVFGVALVALGLRLRQYHRSLGATAADQGRPAPAA
jgi:uncharacterized membrane protein HdeD (DUF308 family)